MMTEGKFDADIARLHEINPFLSNTDLVYTILRDQIVNHKLQPGKKLNQEQIAIDMNVSRTPVREALIELAKVKIIETYPQRKSVVSLIDYDLVDESRFMRDVLECAIVEQVCELVTPADLQALEENVRLQNFYLDNYDPENLMWLDNKFHENLFRIARKSQIHSLIQNISIHFDRVRSMSLVSVESQQAAVQDHEEITRQIRLGNAEMARQQMETHLSRYKFDALKIQAEFPQYFKQPPSSARETEAGNKF